jgi:hypothetical protein
MLAIRFSRLFSRAVLLNLASPRTLTAIRNTCVPEVFTPLRVLGLSWCFVFI